MAAKLEAYRAKRDFDKTAEPSGEREAAPSPRLRFVVQKHDATRLHYDFRLEHEGVLKSWAVTKGPSLDPHDRRLAVEVEDHPVDYGDFEGTIPKGQYGGGTVMLWDRGVYAPEPGHSVEEGLRKGDLKIVLQGERLKGGWVLVRMKRDRDKGKRTNWLLIKHRDGTEHDADADALLAQDTSVASGRSLEQIAEGKGRKPKPFFLTADSTDLDRPDAVWTSDRSPEASAEAATAEAESQSPPPKSKAAKPAKASTTAKRVPAKKAPAKAAAAMPSFIHPQLCRSVDRPPTGAGWAHEIKFDGYRLQLRAESGGGAILTRSGLDWSDKFPEIAAIAARLPDCVIDGEAVALDEHGSPDFPGLQAALSSGDTDDLVFFAFDLLFLSGEDLRDQPLHARKAALKTLLAKLKGQDAARLRYVDHFEAAGEAVLASACRMNLEGVVSKKLDAPYRSGRSETWVKAKCRGGQEVVIAGWTTTGDAFRSLIAGVYREGRLVHVGRIGTGYGKAKVDALLPRLRAVETDQNPFKGKGAPRGGPDVHWVKPVLVAEIQFAGWTGDGSLRQASFKALREDKPAKEVTAEAPAPAEDTELPDLEAETRASAATPAAPRAGAAKAAPDAMGVRLSNPDKPLWPDDGAGQPVTKRDLAQYLEAVAERIMPHVKGRPCSVIRAPDGIEGERFFQRHAMRGTSALLTLAEVRGDKQPYLQIDRPEALIAVAQTGGVELHPWNCEPNLYEVPGRLVFDLDPAPDVDFAQVIAGAKEVRQRLQDVGLESFCKTTGGKGLHVVTPLRPDPKGPDWPAAKAFAREVCARMAADSPERYLISMAKKDRGGRIFLDYLRNDRLSTAVAPYSPRGRPQAPVSMPVSWSQVRKGLDPLRYTMRTVPALLKSDPWADYCDAERPLKAAIAALG